MTTKSGVATKRKYNVLNTENAKHIVLDYLKQSEFDVSQIQFGLPEINDRYHTWKVPIFCNSTVVGEISVNAFTSQINENLSSDLSVVFDRISKISDECDPICSVSKKNSISNFTVSNLKSTIAKGRAENVLATLPEQSIDMIFTSPPYFNARKEYSEYETYEDYLYLMQKIIKECNRVLIDGKFFIINSSHVLIPRSNRNESSSRIAVPFDLHQIIIEEGFEFIDDIIWQKPEGAGWASGRGRRFAADRNPMQYKAVPVTEYVMVYRKKPCVLIDHFIRDNPNPEIIQKSKIADGYEKTNVWQISPARDKRHPAVFPKELAEKVIRYYSFINDIVLDPFAGIGTTAKVAASLNRRFFSIETLDKYIDITLADMNELSSSFLVDFDFVYQDLSDLPSSDDDTSFKSLVKKLLHSGYTKADLYKILDSNTHFKK